MTAAEAKERLLHSKMPNDAERREMDAGLSIVRLAEISGIAQTTISLLERKSLRGGWYEVIKNWDDYNSVAVEDFVTHWMPLPEPAEEA